jgi:hypothetical protein
MTVQGIFEFMLPHLLPPTPFREVNDFLSQLLASQKALLREQFVGLYLGGSLALRAFNLDRSDLDFVAVTFDQLPPEVILDLENLHAQLYATDSKWAKKLDGSYVPRETLRHWTANHPPCPFVEGDQFQVTNQGSAVIQRHIIREHGVTIVGPDPHDFIDPVAVDEMQGALRDMAETWLRPELDNPSWVAQTRNQPFAILTMCRSLYILEYGDVASKAVAGRWAQKMLGPSWIEPIEWALKWPRGSETDHTIPTLNLIAYTLDRFHQIDKRL